MLINAFTFSAIVLRLMQVDTVRCEDIASGASLNEISLVVFENMCLNKRTVCKTNTQVVFYT